MAAIPTRTSLCALQDIPDPGAIGIELEGGADIIIARNGGQPRAYINSCPHQGTPLEIFPDRFLTSDKKRLLCTTHGAEFRIEDGMCVRGPCKGQALSPIGIKITGETIKTI